MKKLFLLFIPLALLLAACSKGDESLLKAVPEDTAVLARIDMKAAAKSMGYSLGDMLKTMASRIKAGDDVKGIDLGGTVYAFNTEDSQFSGILLPVSDAEALRDYLTGNGEAVSETDGIYQVGTYAAFDSKRLVVASGIKATPLNLHSLLKQDRIDGDVEELNEQLESVEEPIAIAVDGEFLKKNCGRDISTSMALASIPVDLDDIYLLVGIDATAKSAVVSTSVTTDESDAQDQLDNIKKKLTPIKDAKIPFVADEYLALAAFNLKGSDLKTYASFLGGIDVDNLLDAINGLATLTITSYTDGAAMPSFTFTAQANDIACMDKLMKQLPGFGLRVKDEGHHNWTIDTSAGLMLVGAQGGYVFANYGNNMQRPKGNNTINLEDGTVAYVSCYPSHIPQLAQYGVEAVEFYATDELTTQTTITLNCTWKELIEKK